IAHFRRRHPDARKPSFHQQLQNVCRVPLVRLLLPHIAGPNLRRIAHPQLVSQLTEQIHQPMAVARRLHPDQRRRRYLPIEPFRISRGLHQLLLPSFSCLRIQPTHLLPAGMKITSYNHHLRLLLSPASWSLNQKRNRHRPQENGRNPPRPAPLEERRFRRDRRRQNQPRRLRPHRSNHPRHRPDEEAVRYGTHAAICPRALRPWTLPKQDNAEEKKNGEEKNEAAKKEVKAERRRDPRDLELSADGKYYYP